MVKFSGVPGAGSFRRATGAIESRRRVGCGEFQAFPPTPEFAKMAWLFRKNGFSQVRLLAIFEASCSLGSSRVAICGEGGHESSSQYSTPTRYCVIRVLLSI